ncbi:ArsC family reductase [Mangrovimicrobium sediminis]|uniref:ArsC family reductase n=1 Tax=Mangrovimicrobium sediminis TaxID=2562682 RepID=A0A4Z0LYC2_9GAMM|nr:ArsC family reductase [Haliea sp. SAOS-164]TGD72085.1 ArsC family reductase [Haliea sp. SAOS-164]
MITLYGIKNCDTVKKARKWLDTHAVEYQYHDLREDGLPRKTAQAWLKSLPWDTVVNKRSTTWKTLDPAQREAMDANSALAAILEHPTLVKRPLLDTGHELHCGFSAAQYATLFERHTL